MDEWMAFQPMFMHCKAILGRGQSWLMRYFGMNPCPSCKVNISTCWSAVQGATNVLQLPRLQKQYTVSKMFNRPLDISVEVKKSNCVHKWLQVKPFFLSTITATMAAVKYFPITLHYISRKYFHISTALQKACSDRTTSHLPRSLNASYHDVTQVTYSRSYTEKH